jgi:hypothetical protein
VRGARFDAEARVTLIDGQLPTLASWNEVRSRSAAGTFFTSRRSSRPCMLDRAGGNGAEQ